ncbi:MAG TPA: tetratricopeptide repeat protein [Chthonomonadaceae bacterium]|nr:tetratricopeptide repeat protein [Chthonomonadaceae bacterium]
MAGKSQRSAVVTPPNRLNPAAPTQSSAAAPSAPRTRLRQLSLILAGLAALALALYLPRGFAAYQDWKLRHMPLPQLQALVKSQPGNVEARYQLGLAYARANRLPEAAREFLAVLDRQPVRPDVLNDLGVVYLLQDRYYESLVALQGALTARPNYATAYANLGRLHLATKMPFTAARELAKAVELDPSRPETLCDLGEAYQRTLNYKSAENAYRRALRLDPRSVPALVGLGRTHFSMARYEEADKELNAALKLAPEDTSALLALGRLRKAQALSDADLQAAQQIFARVCQIAPEDASAWYEQGRIALQRGHAPEAVEMLTRALKLSPQYLAAWNQLDRALRAVGRTQEADRAGKIFREASLREREETHLEEVTSRSPQDWDAKARLAALYLQSGKRGLAMLICRQLKEGAPDHPMLPKLLQEINPPAAPPVPAALLQRGGR